MGESGKRELRKTPEGKLRRKEYEKREDTKKAKTEKGEMGEMVKRKRGRRKERSMRREQFPSGGEQKTQKSPFTLTFPL